VLSAFRSELLFHCVFLAALRQILTNDLPPYRLRRGKRLTITVTGASLTLYMTSHSGQRVPISSSTESTPHYASVHHHRAFLPEPGAPACLVLFNSLRESPGIHTSKWFSFQVSLHFHSFYPSSTQSQRSTAAKPAGTMPPRILPLRVSLVTHQDMQCAVLTHGIVPQMW
jgi:hypothetical protein